MTTTAKKYIPYEGEDGELYFTYCLGAEYVFSASGVEFSQRIVECSFEDGEEYYVLESAGKILPTRFSVSEVAVLLARLPYTQVEEGERVKLPLLDEEVKLFFQQLHRESNFANVNENNKLKGTEYAKTLTNRGRFADSLRLAMAEGNEAEAEDIKKKIGECDKKLAEIIKDKGVDEAILKKRPRCPICGDTGFAGGKICQCALAREDKIKAYAAAVRLAKRSSPTPGAGAAV